MKQKPQIYLGVALSQGQILAPAGSSKLSLGFHDDAVGQDKIGAVGVMADVMDFAVRGFVEEVVA